MRELILTFNRNCHATNNARNYIFEKALAKAIAYAVPCYYGEGLDAYKFYSRGVSKSVNDLVNKANELKAFSIDSVMRDVRDIWVGRYTIANSPIHYDRDLEKFDSTCVVAGTNIMQEVNVIYKMFHTIIKAELAGENVC